MGLPLSAGIPILFLRHHFHFRPRNVLRLLFSINNQGAYPAHKVAEILRNGTGKPPQGQGYMPVWEPLLKSMNSESQDVIDLRIRNLTEYVRTLQARLVAEP